MIEGYKPAEEQKQSETLDEKKPQDEEEKKVDPIESPDSQKVFALVDFKLGTTSTLMRSIQKRPKDQKAAIQKRF